MAGAILTVEAARPLCERGKGDVCQIYFLEIRISELAPELVTALNRHLEPAIRIWNYAVGAS